MAGAPDVRVRLSAEGVDEVVRALGKIRAASEKAGKSAGKGKGFGLLNEALEDMKGLLPQLGIAAAVAGLGALAKRAVDTADKIGKLSAKTGVSAQAISVFNVAGKTADATFEQLSGGLVKFNKTMGDLDRGSKDAGEAVRLLFGNSKALEGLNSEQRLLKVVDAIGRMEAGYKKARAAQDFFGKSGADLIPLMNELADGGFERAAEKARKLGLIIDEDLAEAAQRANDNMQDLKLAAEGAATQFAAGLAPAVADASKALLEATTGEGVNGIRKVGEIVGSVLKGIASAFIVAGKAVGAWVEFIVAGFDDLIERFKIAGQLFTTAPSNWGAVFEKANQQVKKAAENRKAIFEYFKEDVLSSLDALWNPQASAGDGGTGGGGTGGEDPKIDPTLVKAAIARKKAQLDAELALAKKYIALDEQAAKAAYERGILDLQKYYEERRVLMLTAFENEIFTLQEKRDLAAKAITSTAAEEVAKRAEIEAIDAAIDQKKLDRQLKLAELNNEEAKKLRDLGKQRADIERRILELQGKTYEATMAAIKDQAEELRKAGIDPKTVERLTTALTRQADFRKAEKAGTDLQGQLDAAQARIENRVAGGEIFPFQAADLYRSVIQAMIPQLTAAADQMERFATTDEDRAAVAAFRGEIDRLKISADENAQAMAEFKASAESALTSDLTNFFTSGIDEAENFGDAMRGLALSVVDSLRQIAAQMLATLATEQILDFFGGGGGPDPGKAAAAGTAQAAPLMAAGTAISAGGAALGAGAAAVSASAASLMAAAQMLMIANSTSSVGFASGGFVSGPGTGTSDSIPARLSNGEFVVRSAVVRQPGILAHLIALNQGSGARSLRSRGSIPRFAEGGLVSAGGLVRTEDAAAQAGIVVGLEEGVIVRKVLGALKTKEAQRIQIENLGHNQKRARNALGR